MGELALAFNRQSDLWRPACGEGVAIQGYLSRSEESAFAGVIGRNHSFLTNLNA